MIAAALTRSTKIPATDATKGMNFLLFFCLHESGSQRFGFGSRLASNTEKNLSLRLRVITTFHSYFYSICIDPCVQIILDASVLE